MSKISTIEPLVEKALRDNEFTRGDNYLLYVEVLKNYISVDRLTFEEVCLHHKTLGIPSLESITRCRRKLQEKHPELIDPDTEKARLEKEQEIRSYAKGESLL